MKNKVAVIALGLISIMAIVYGYIEKTEADVLRKDNEELHLELKRVQHEAEAARAEAAKMRMMAEAERMRAEQHLIEANKQVEQSKAKRK
ncbi:MAG: hypothetical protein L0Y35_02880 [Flammeovirgaceae bacterium]|nr:hypothetical protein [Flammeovirgaceae bacterium]